MRYVAYYRVSTQKQGQSGLGLESQRDTVQGYLRGQQDADLIGEFSEVESGTKDDRPELQKALRACRLKGATLLIAKLDRLSRSHRFLVELQDSSVNFICCDMPEANRLTIGLLANIADYERQLISERTKAALQAAKARGTKLGNPNLHLYANRDPRKATAARVAKASEFKAEMRDVIREICADAQQVLSARETARRLNDAGYQTPRGAQWTAVQVSRVMAA